MASRRPEGAALLVAGHGTAGAIDASMVHTLGQIGEALLATAAPWTIRRLSSAAGERYAADRGSLKQHLDELCADPVRVLVLVVLGSVVELPAGPALVTGTQVREYPEDATLPLAWIGERLRAAKAEQLLVVFSASGGDGRGWLDALATGRPHDVIAVGSTSDGCPLADALLGGLCGDALDPRTGTVTMRSISEHLSDCVPGALLQVSTASATIAESPPLAGLWDVRRSQLATHTARTPLPTAEDLTGSVLPGRFRIDAIVARGTFGTVYRARQLAVERDVAVKVLHADIDPASEDGRLFVHEIRSVGRIDHGNVVRIHQADITHDGRLFFAMELLDGRDLQQLIADEPLPKAAALELIRQLLAGLGAAHAAGLVHADVKPANALVVKRDGRDHLVLVDFGLARLRAPDRPALSAGGTPAYMAPEQLHDGRVDARSDLFSAALVLVALLTRWRRPNAHTLVPSLANIDDASLRGVLARALALDPAKRYQTARALAEALTGGPPPPAPNVTQPTPFLPFHHLAALTERDRGRLHGRESDVAVLTEHVLYRRSVIYAAPSGTGKTSLLRAGLLPRLETLGIHAVYVRCRGADGAVAAAIWPAATSIASAIAEHHAQRGSKLVLVLDQLEALDGASTLIHDVLAFDRWGDADVSVVLSVREDHLARLLARTQPDEPGMAIVRLPPLRPAGARAAITGPLVEARLAIEPELLDALLDDLQRAAAAIGSEIGWGSAPAVFPPHLQLACSVLYEALGPGEATLTLAHYRRLGGFDAIVGEHLERVVDSELADGRDVIARDLFVALVTTAHERAMRPESELLEIVGAQHGGKRVLEVLELLRARGLLVRVRVEAGDPSWELVHDSLVPRVLAWVDRRDLARRRAVELVRYHLRRSQPAAPSLLGRAELREVRDHADAIAELETEMKKRGGDDVWTPRRLVAHSLRSQRRRIAAAVSMIVLAAAIAGISLYITFDASARARHEQSMRDRDLGRFTLALEPFDWDPVTRRETPVSAAALPGLRWRLSTVAGSPIGEPDEPFGDGAVVYGTPAIDGLARVEHVEAHGGAAFVIIEGRGRGGATCARSEVPLKLPGYALRSAPERTLHVRVPTCAASRADMIEIPAGPFIYGGAGEPPSAMAAGDPAAQERQVDEPAFALDRTEVTNAALDLYAAATGIPRPSYPATRGLAGASDPTKPVVGITWDEARAYCAFYGKTLPTSRQWQKALRGGLHLADGTPNPMPRRTFPWGATAAAAPANIGPDSHPAIVGSFPLDRSPYGVLDLAGNVSEWTATEGEIGLRIIRGGNYESTTAESFADFVAIENRRPVANRDYTTGMRCAAK